MRRMFVRNTFLELEECEETGSRQRAVTEAPTRARSPTGLEREPENSAIDSCNALLGSRGRLDSLKKQQLQVSTTAALKTVMSTDSVSTMVPDSDDGDSEFASVWDIEDDAKRDETAPPTTMHRMFVRNTFLEIVEEREEPGKSQRASSEPPIRARSPTGSDREPEDATIDCHSKILGNTCGQDSPKRQQQMQSSTKTAPLKKVMSLPSVSTMTLDAWANECSNEWDVEDDAARDETALPQARPLPRCIPEAVGVGVPTGSLCNMTLCDLACRNAASLQSQLQLEQFQQSKQQRHQHHQGMTQYPAQTPSVNLVAGKAPAGRRCQPELRRSCRLSHPSMLPDSEFTHSSVPKNVNLAEEFSKVSALPPTTMMLRNIPNRYSQHELIEELGVLGFAGSFDFLYAPMDFGTMGNVGYAFINFTSSDWAARFQLDLEGFVFAKHQKKSVKKVSTVSVAHLQGLEANLHHYQKSAVTGRGRSKNCGPIVLPRLSQDVEIC